MVNTELLETAIKNSGKSRKFLAAKIGKTPTSLRRKVKGMNDFTNKETDILCEELGIHTLTEKEQIFFA